MNREDPKPLSEEQVDIAARPVASIQFVEKNGQKEVSFVLRRVFRSTNDATLGSSALTSSKQAVDSMLQAESYNCLVQEKLRWEIAWCTLLDDNNFSLLAALVNQHSPGICYIPENMHVNPKANRSIKKLMAALSTCEIVAKPVKHFKVGNLHSSLLALTEKPNLSFFQGLDKAPRIQGCMECLLRCHASDAALGSYCVVQLDIQSHMKLDHSAVSALHLFPASKTEDRFNSLFGMLNCCKTKKIGARLLERWIRQPLLSVDAIEARQEMVQVFVDEQLVRQNLRDEHLQGVPDLQRIVTKFDRDRASLEDVYKYYGFCQTLQPILALLGEVDAEALPALKNNFIKPLQEMVTHFQPFISMIHLILDFNALERMPPIYQINPKCDMAQQYGLRELDEDIRAIETEITDLFNDQYQPNFGIKSLSLDRNREHGFTLRCPLKQHNIVKRLHNCKVLKVLTNRVIFTTIGPNGITQKARHFKALLAEYEQKQFALVSEVLAVAKSYGVVIDKAIDLVAQLDVVTTLAHVSVNAPMEYVRPKLLPMGTGNVEIKAARHPCMEWHENMNFIPNDFSMVRDKSRFLIITGPNMGGKSTYIRQLGVISVMAQIGCFVPAESATLPVMDAVWARVGAGDHQLKGISTFMAEMLEAAAIVKNATESSLVIIDELGRGTSTYDGFGLAWAIADHLVNSCKSLAFFATHFHELTAMADENKAVTNLHVAALTTDNSITMLYEVRPGPCDRSYGIHVAEVVGFPQPVIAHAKRKVTEFESASTGTHSPTSEAGKQVKRAKLSESEKARLVKFVQEFRSLDRKHSAEKVTASEMIRSFRKECSANQAN